MSRVAELIDLIVQGKNAEASEVLSDELLSRSYQAVSDSKPRVAAEYFASIVDDPNQTTEDEPTVEEEPNEAD